MKPAIRICMGSSCFARGNRENLRVIERFLEEHQLAGTVELSGTCCEDVCTLGPTIHIDGEDFYRVDPYVLIDLLQEKLLTTREEAEA